ncbi:MAG: DUF1643 domain-containing protein [Ammonifex sp.]|jgi:hypothetical protein|nr:MAG: DUF1643 domain-containing protein [Ammonifex sp.]
MKSSAEIDETGKYRYSLIREWRTRQYLTLLQLPDIMDRACFIMLNPSTADARQDDPTIRRCISLAKAWGCGGIEVVNLFAYRATDPRELLRAADPVGPENDKHIVRAAMGCQWVVAAWGTRGAFKGRDKQVIQLIQEIRKPLYCVGLTKDGHPRHPLYARRVPEPILFCQEVSCSYGNAT